MIGKMNLETDTHLISPSMRQSYLRFGDLVALDISYGLLRDVAQDDPK